MGGMLWVIAEVSNQILIRSVTHARLRLDNVIAHYECLSWAFQFRNVRRQRKNRAEIQGEFAREIFVMNKSSCARTKTPAVRPGVLH
jgi:hypothetical protein